MIVLVIESNEEVAEEDGAQPVLVPRNALETNRAIALVFECRGQVALWMDDDGDAADFEFKITIMMLNSQASVATHQHWTLRSLLLPDRFVNGPQPVLQLPEFIHWYLNEFSGRVDHCLFGSAALKLLLIVPEILQQKYPGV